MEVMCGIKGNRFQAIRCFINGILDDINWFFRGCDLLAVACA